MALIEIKRTVNLDGLVQAEALNGVAFTQENAAHKFTITCMRGGKPYALTGTLSGRFMRADGQTINIPSSSTCTITNGVASIVLPRDCYNVAGRFQLAVLCTAGSAVLCIYAAVGHITRSTDDTVLDTGTVLPDTATLAAQLVEFDSLMDDAHNFEGRITAAEASITEDEQKIARVVQYGRNQYRVQNKVIGYVVYGSTGVLHEASGYATTGFIDVTAGETYKAAYWDPNAGTWGAISVFTSYAFYDANEEYISGDTSGLASGVTAPSGATLIRFSIFYNSPTRTEAENASAALALGYTVFASTDIFPDVYEGYYQPSAELAFNTSICAPFSSAASYEPGDLCTYYGQLYRCTAAHQGAWNGSHFTPSTVNYSIGRLKQEIAEPFSASTSYSPGDYCYHNDYLVRCITAHTGAWNAAHFNSITVADELEALNDRPVYTFADDGDGNVTIS